MNHKYSDLFNVLGTCSWLKAVIVKMKNITEDLCLYNTTTQNT